MGVQWSMQKPNSERNSECKSSRSIMPRNISVGIDIGTSQVKVVAAENVREDGHDFPRVVGVGFAESRGLRQGYILNQGEAARSVRNAVAQAEKAAGVPLKRVIASIGGITLGSITTTGTVVITRADNEITEIDVKTAIEASREEIPKPYEQNRRIIHIVPLAFRVDGKPIPGKPEGLKGSKLEARTLFITCFEHHISDLLETLQSAGLEVEEIVAAPIAASLVTLTRIQKMAGCVLANIGAETVSIVVYENNLPISLEIFPIGSNNITHDIALGMRVPLEEAEDLKRGSIVGSSYPRKKLDDIIEARLGDIFELIESHLKKIGKSALLPAGIILTGGGSAIETIADLAKAALRLPSRVASVSFGDTLKGQIKDASWSVAYGLSLIGLQESDEENFPGVRSGGKKQAKKIVQLVNFLRNLFRQFLP